MTNQRRGKKVTTGHKITMGAAGIIGLMAGWNIIAHSEAPDSSALAEGPAETAASVVPASTAAPATATPWPTIAPLGPIAALELQPLPTLAVTRPPQPAFVSPGMPTPGAVTDVDLSLSVSIAPLPTLAPLPDLPQYVAPPPAPPAPVADAAPPPPPSGGNGNGNGSQGS